MGNVIIFAGGFLLGAACGAAVIAGLVGKALRDLKGSPALG